MTPLLISLALNFALIGVIAYLLRREDEREKATRLERTGLLTRIQAPEAAPFIEATENGGMQYVPFEDDDALKEALDELADANFKESE